MMDSLKAAGQTLPSVELAFGVISHLGLFNGTGWIGSWRAFPTVVWSCPWLPGPPAWDGVYGTAVDALTASMSQPAHMPIFVGRRSW